MDFDYGEKIMKQTTHTRIYEETLKKLRHIHAETGKRMLDILDQLISTEWDKAREQSNVKQEIK